MNAAVLIPAVSIVIIQWEDMTAAVLRVTLYNPTTEPAELTVSEFFHFGRWSLHKHS